MTEEKKDQVFKLPETVKIGHTTFTVELKSDMIKTRDFVSECNLNTNEYLLQEGMHPAKLRHELFYLIHGTLSNLGMPHLERPGPGVLANIAYMILRENQSLSSVDLFEAFVGNGFWAFHERWRVIVAETHWHNNASVDSQSRIIRINGVLPPDERWEAAWHEVYHKIFNWSNLKDSEDHATLMAHLMCNFLDMNDVSWIYFEPLEFDLPWSQTQGFNKDVGHGTATDVG